MEMFKNVTQYIAKALNSKYICKLIAIVLVITLFNFVSLIGELNYAFADTFDCYDKTCRPEKALVNSNECKKDRDYTITAINNENEITVLSIHGGKIEDYTSEISWDLSKRYGWNFYDFNGHIEKDTPCWNLDTSEFKDKNFPVLHITSTNFDEPDAIDLVESHKKAVSIHGFSRTEKIPKTQTICVGGANEAQVSKFIEYIEGKRDKTDKIKDLLGYSLNIINVPASESIPQKEKEICLKPRSLKGTDEDNIVNRTNKGLNNNDKKGGLQIELNRKIRADLAEGKDERNASPPNKNQLLRNVIYDAINHAMVKS
jgi:phage replication-related protein YjqB (UPF0714/DUF867 family)